MRGVPASGLIRQRCCHHQASNWLLITGQQQVNFMAVCFNTNLLIFSQALITFSRQFQTQLHHMRHGRVGHPGALDQLKELKIILHESRTSCGGWHCQCLTNGMVQRSLPQTGSHGSHLLEAVAKLRNVIKPEIPAGYQDETGFHYGVKPAEKEIHWPPFW